MTANPADLVYLDGIPVNKSDVRSFEKVRGRLRVANADEIRNADFSGQYGGLYRADTKTNYDLEPGSTEPDDGTIYIKDLTGNRFKLASSVPSPTVGTLGGVFEHQPISHQFLTGIDDDGTPLSAVPDVVDLTGLDTDGSLAANSDSKVATQKATKTYVDGIVGALDVMVLKTTIDCSTNPNYPAADKGWTYVVSVAGRLGGASGVQVEAGDMAICIVDGTSSGNQATAGANWRVIQTNIAFSAAGLAMATAATATAQTALLDTASNSTKGLVKVSTNSSMVTGAATDEAARVVDVATNFQTKDAQLFSNIPQNSKSAAYTTIASDAQKCIYHPPADTAARVWTIDSNANVPYQIGTVITFDNDFSAGAITIAITSDTLVLVGAAGSTGSRTLASGGQAVAMKVAATRWRINGTGLT